MYIVLVTQGKKESVGHVTVKLFDGKSDAQIYCGNVSDTGTKYWTRVQIVPEGIEIEDLCEYHDEEEVF